MYYFILSYKLNWTPVGLRNITRVKPKCLYNNSDSPTLKQGEENKYILIRTCCESLSIQYLFQCRYVRTCTSLSVNETHFGWHKPFLSLLRGNVPWAVFYFTWIILLLDFEDESVLVTDEFDWKRSLWCQQQKTWDAFSSFFWNLIRLFIFLV